MNFYSVIIGTELLNGRRRDGHFSFLNGELLMRGWEQTASFVIRDEPPLMEAVFRLVEADPNSVLFSFGGIGATPDDYTRQAAANVLGGGRLVRHPEALRLIEERFGEAARPHRVRMADLPAGAGLMENPVTGVPGFSLRDRFFFVPGFPRMAHPMISAVLDRLFPKGPRRFRRTMTALCSENDLMDAMARLPKSVEFSSLPTLKPRRETVLSLAAGDEAELERWWVFLQDWMEERGISYRDGEEKITQETL